VCSNIASYLGNSISRNLFHRKSTLEYSKHYEWSLFIKAQFSEMPLIPLPYPSTYLPSSSCPSNTLLSNIPRACLAINNSLMTSSWSSGYPWIVTNLVIYVPYTLPLSPTFNQHILTLYSDPSWSTPAPRTTKECELNITVPCPPSLKFPLPSTPSLHLSPKTA